MANSTYPKAIKVFTTYHDYSDIIFSVGLNEIHDEVGSIESTLGVNPLVAAPTYVTSIGGAIADLYNTKANKAHQHIHASLPDDVIEPDGSLADDHRQYMRVDGARGFTGPVAGQWASNPAHLIPLGQVQSYGYINLNDANALIASRLTNLVTGSLGGAPLFGPGQGSPNWRLTGGFCYGCTDSAGRLACYLGYWDPPGVFHPAFGQTVQGFVATKLPPWGFPRPPCPPYNYIEAQVTLVGISTFNAIVQFSHDYSFQPGLWAAFSWLAIGV